MLPIDGPWLKISLN